MGSVSDEILIREVGRCGRITLNRPDALNALTHGMVLGIAEALERWRGMANIEHVVLDGAGDRAFCAGGDVLAFYEASPRGSKPQLDFGAIFWRDEYRLNAAIHRYPKPFVALMDGIVMGGGVGLSAHARYRIVTDKTMIAMPETTIGLVPDVGGTFLLSRAQGRFGEFLGLTGQRMTGSDAIQMGFAGTFVTRTRLPDLLAALERGHGADVEALIEDASEPVPLSPLAAQHDLVSKIFATDTVPAMLDASLRSTDALAQKAHADLHSRSPLALTLTLEAIRRARLYRSLEEALNAEYRLVTRLFDHGEFVEGVRALLVDKDKAPKWSPSELRGVTPAMVAEFFAPLPAGKDLGLVTPGSQ